MLRILKDLLGTLGWLALWIGIPTMLVVLWFLYASYIAPFRGADFTPEAWAKAKAADTAFEQQERDRECPRGAMIRDLLDNHLSTDMTQAETEALLGQAEPFSHENYADCSAYSLGFCRIASGEEQLVLCFENNKLITSQLSTSR